MDSQDRDVAESACRALVRVEASCGSQAGRATPRTDAGFLALLLAHRIGAETTRERRRAAPGPATLAYARAAALAGDERYAAQSLRTV